MHNAAIVTLFLEEIKDSRHVIRQSVIILIICKKYQLFINRLFGEKIKSHRPEPKEKELSSEKNKFFL